MNDEEGKAQDGETTMQMNRMAMLVALLLVVVCMAHSQTVATIPFGSSGNRIELTVVNRSKVQVSGASVKVISLPGWMHMKEEVSLPQIKPQQEADAVFTFSVDKFAPVGQERTLVFMATTTDGERWTKEIRLKVAAPERLELEQNYPNPFNPTTDIQFTIPNCQLTILKVYNVLGQEVATLVNEVKQPGGYEVTWNAGAVPSGTYFYRLTAGSFSETKKLMLVR